MIGSLPSGTGFCSLTDAEYVKNIERLIDEHTYTDIRLLMRFLVFTTLYPNVEMPTHGIFVENRLRAFLKDHDAEVKVIAPVPWFPFSHKVFGQYARYARVPEKEIRHGIEILHPRYFIPPKIAMNYAPIALARVLRKTIRKLTFDGWGFDFLDAHYFYPDGVAAAKVATELGKPVVITARGTDINFIPAFEIPRQKIIDATIKADAVITVADALKTELIRLGAPAQKIKALRNGVDLEFFHPTDRDHIRREMALEGLVIASVGHLIDRKGHELVIEALKDIPGATLLIVGEGEKRKTLEALAPAIGVVDRVRFLGAVPHEKMREIYEAADVLVLASSREGWPNVLLEAMACGTPCVAANIWGTSEIIRDPSAGILVDHRAPQAFAAAINNLLTNLPDRTKTRACAEKHSWSETVEGMAAIFSDLSSKAKAAHSITTSPIKLSNAGEPPKLIVTVDTEERFDWNDFNSNDYACCDPKDIDQFQQLCSSANIEPLYFLTYPLMKDHRTSEYFRKLHDAGAASCGLHLHPWVTPPTANFTGEVYSFQKNLPCDLHREKLKALAELYETVFNARALSHRAGRYGIAPENYHLLSEIGVNFDFSPSTSFDFSRAGGPDFTGASNTPFIASHGEWKIHVTPVSGACAIRKTSIFLSRKRAPIGFALPWHDAFQNFTLPMRLSPEGAKLSDLKALTRRLIKDKTPVMTFTLHSTSLTPGANSYSRDAADVERILALSRQYFDWFRKSMRGEIISLGGLSSLYAQSSSEKQP
ncbi:MAG: glycosyltransferase [Marinicaulis sp.]|nr:glycosyltransferase [Marinicaulis sp.]